MVVIVLSACPAGLRGHLTRWLLEISAGVFVGHVSVRVRDLLWLNVCEMTSGGRALMVFSVWCSACPESSGWTSGCTTITGLRRTSTD